MHKNTTHLMITLGALLAFAGCAADTGDAALELEASDHALGHYEGTFHDSTGLDVHFQIVDGTVNFETDSMVTFRQISEENVIAGTDVTTLDLEDEAAVGEFDLALESADFLATQRAAEALAEHAQNDGVGEMLRGVLRIASSTAPPGEQAVAAPDANDDAPCMIQCVQQYQACAVWCGENYPYNPVKQVLCAALCESDYIACIAGCLPVIPGGPSAAEEPAAP